MYYTTFLYEIRWICSCLSGIAIMCTGALRLFLKWQVRYATFFDGLEYTTDCIYKNTNRSGVESISPVRSIYPVVENRESSKNYFLVLKKYGPDMYVTNGLEFRQMSSIVFYTLYVVKAAKNYFFAKTAPRTLNICKLHTHWTYQFSTIIGQTRRWFWTGRMSCLFIKFRVEKKLFIKRKMKKLSIY